MKTIALAFGILLVGIVLGAIAEKHKWTELVWEDADWVVEEPIVIHYCGCIQDNPESYNALLDEAERINEEILEATKLFQKRNNLKTFDFSALIRVTSNGNPRIVVFCSHRSPRISALYSNYRKMVSPYFEQYRARFDEIHEEFSQHSAHLPNEE
jgi:hypothetical protein